MRQRPSPIAPARSLPDVFWRRKPQEDQDQTQEPVQEPVAEPVQEPVAEPLQPEVVGPGWEPDPSDFDDPTPEPVVAAEPFVAAEPAGSLEAGVARTRGGFVARLRGLLGGGSTDGPSWDEVEEILIAGD